ncbi:unnamed protein product [Thlaspi arvense]|uniref:Uncharacterized protein n=1 Tax=Thlaspi arvense TaxID=13288 RepID=A0AAU9RNF1_THLAR|nr:unnamed protein product [Thlaspi arvense]
MEEEVVRLGVELSVSVAETMFLLCDDIRTLLCFCLRLYKYVVPQQGAVSERLLLVIHHVYSKDIKPKNGVYRNGDGKSAQWNLIRTSWNDYVCGILVLQRLVMVLRRTDFCFDDRLLLSAIEKYKRQLKSLEGKLRSARDVSEANGFAREKIESDTCHFWKSLFDEEGGEVVITKSILGDLFEPDLDVDMDTEIRALPLFSPYVLGRGFAKDELQHEAVRLGVELSLYVAESMFLLCGGIRRMLWFCYELWRDAKRDWNRNSPVLERVIRVMHYVYFKDIEPKNGVYDPNAPASILVSLARLTLPSFDDVIISLDALVAVFSGRGGFGRGREIISRIERELGKVDDKLRLAKSISEANGFRMEAIQCSLFALWESLFDKDAKEATQTLKVINHDLVLDLFQPLVNEVAPQPLPFLV